MLYRIVAGSASDITGSIEAGTPHFCAALVVLDTASVLLSGVVITCRIISCYNIGNIRFSKICIK